jgi:ABC-type phosphate transport system auxiliary subunit
MTDLFDQIDDVLSSSVHDLDQIERTLTDGYAHALSLEAERWRLEKRMTWVAREIGDGDQATKVRELSSLSQSLDVNAEHLERLRALLASLRRHADGVRVGSRAG